jgi:hypothetical protein
MAAAALLLLAVVPASGQNSTGQNSTEQGSAEKDSICETPSLADVARKTREENAAPGHVPGKQFGNDEDDGPDATGIWRVRLCMRTPCYELSVTLPKEAKWTRAKDEPRPVLIPLSGRELVRVDTDVDKNVNTDKDASRVIRLYAAELPTGPAPFYASLDGAKRQFLQGWFSRTEYFGQAARILQDEHRQADLATILISHFTVASPETKFRGISIIAASPNGNYGFACVYRDEDADAAASICDAIVNSAHSQALEPGQRTIYPYYRPPVYYPYYPRIDDPAPDPQRGYLGPQFEPEE